LNENSLTTSVKTPKNLRNKGSPTKKMEESPEPEFKTSLLLEEIDPVDSRYREKFNYDHTYTARSIQKDYVKHLIIYGKKAQRMIRGGPRSKVEKNELGDEQNSRDHDEIENDDQEKSGEIENEEENEGEEEDEEVEEMEEEKGYEEENGHYNKSSKGKGKNEKKKPKETWPPNRRFNSKEVQSKSLNQNKDIVGALKTKSKKKQNVPSRSYPKRMSQKKQDIGSQIRDSDEKQKKTYQKSFGELNLDLGATSSSDNEKNIESMET